MEDNKLLQINPDDNVAIALAGLKGPGVYRCGDRMVRITEDIGPAHKVALRQIEKGGHRKGSQGDTAWGTRPYT